MDDLFNKLSTFIAGLGLDQYAALVLVIVAVVVALSVAKKVLSAVCSAVGLLAALYFVQPELYQKAIHALGVLWERITA